MAKETIRRLSENVGRLLVAGAHLAPSDPELKKDHAALLALAKQVGDKAPAIVRLEETAGKALTGSGPSAAAELMSLATTAAQVRAAQAAAAVPGPQRPLAEVPPVPTTCNGRDLDDLHTALVERGQGRKEVIERAIEGGYIADLRLVEALIYAMGDPWVGDVVSDRAIPALGRAVVSPIRRRLNVKGGTTVDARRLRALVAVQKQDALDVLAAAVKEGSPPLREAAMDAIADHVAGVAEFERYALEAIARDRSKDIQRAAIRALGGYASDASLDAMLAAMDNTDAAVASAAAEALGRSANPKAVEKILTRLQELLAEKPPAKKVKRASKNAKNATKAANDVTLEAWRLGERLLGALAGHNDPAIAHAAMALIPEYGAAAAWAAVGSANHAQLVQLADLLGAHDGRLFPVAVAAAARLGADEAFKRLSAPFAPKGLRKPKGDKQDEARADTVLAYLAANPAALDPRWCGFLLEVLQGRGRDEGLRVVGVLGIAREKRAVPTLLTMLKTEKKPETVRTIVHALGQIGDPRALDSILQLTGASAARLVWVVHEAVLAINDPVCVDKVRTLYARRESWHLRSLLRTLESRFPGS